MQIFVYTLPMMVNKERDFSQLFIHKVHKDVICKNKLRCTELKLSWRKACDKCNGEI